MPGPAYEIALPLRPRPLSETPAKHRKRATVRRGYWAAVAKSARRAILPHVVPAPAGAGLVRELTEPVPTPLPEV